MVQAQGLTDKRILTIVSGHKIETTRVRQLMLISKDGWKKARVLLSKLERYYYTIDQACKEYRIGPVKFRKIISAASLQGVQNGHFKYYKKAELEPLLRDRLPKISKEITKNYIRCKDALKKYHIGLQRFLDETKANNVEKDKDCRQIRLVQEIRIRQTLQETVNHVCNKSYPPETNATQWQDNPAP